MAFAQPPTMSSLPSPSASAPRKLATSDFFSERARKQLGLFFGGAGFFFLSSMITRRALVRRYKSTVPKFYQPSNRQTEVNGAMEAFDALTVASVNVFSATLMAAGGALWAFDISTVDDMRRKIRGGLGIDGGSGRESRAEQEMEEWLATVLARKDEKDKTRKNDGTN